MEIEKILSEMTLEEKAGLCAGADFWHTKAVERLGVPSVMVSDGPHGLRTQHENADGTTETIEAVCFPSGAGIAASFDRALAARLGDTLGREALAVGVNTVLGPAVNIKRSPLCGRNFEYLSEDPYLAGEMAAAYTNGVQKNGVGVSVKHFAANNQEFRRMSVSDTVSEQALREIYFPAFENVVRKAKPWTVMCSYNRINGTYSCENKWLLSDVLRGEWGFDGIVMTDWGAMNDRCAAVKAGLDLEMPGPCKANDQKLVDAVRNGKLDEAVLDARCRELLRWIEKARAGAEAGCGRKFDRAADAEIAEQLECECAVLLKNNQALPLEKQTQTVFIGGFAKKPRYQGGGSSNIRASGVISAMEAAAGLPVQYAEGFSTDGDLADSEKFAQAVAAAKKAKAAVIFAGLPDSFESEGYDRAHLDLPECQNRLIEEVAAVQPNTIVVLHNGSPVTMPWLDKVSAVLELYLGGQSVGAAAVKLLYGDANPSGRLAETFPLRLEDTSSYLDFADRTDTVTYNEGVYVGYRWYDARRLPVLFPFGFGLSYTTFALSDLKLSAPAVREEDVMTARATVRNTGSRAGCEVVQLYIAPPQDGVRRPLRALRGFEKVELKPGESKEISFTLQKRDFAYFEAKAGRWFVPAGNYTVCVGTSSRDLPLQQEISLDFGDRLPLVLSDTTTCGDVWSCAQNSEVLDKMLRKLDVLHAGQDDNGLGGDTEKMMREFLAAMPLHSLTSFGANAEAVEEVMRQLR